MTTFLIIVVIGVVVGFACNALRNPEGKAASPDSQRPANPNLPCLKTGSCPYEYDRQSDRDIEGMPFLENDDRSCPVYGHICPEFMEQVGFTPEDLEIRAVIHCGSLLDIAAANRPDINPEAVAEMKKRLSEVVILYPIDRYPQYYSVDGSPAAR